MTEAVPITGGTLEQIWRHPVKSMAGESISHTRIGKLGVKHDRQWCLYDAQTNTITTAKSVPEVLGFAAKLDPEAPGDLLITLPNGNTVSSRAPDIHTQLSEALGRDVRLSHAPSRWNLQYYKRRKQLTPRRMRMLLGVKPNEPLPDLSRAPLSALLTVALFESPPGTHFDAQPIHIVTRHALERFEASTPPTGADVRRFRPNLVLDGIETDLAGPEWFGRTISIGSVKLRIVGETLRCSMPAQAQPGLAKEMQVTTVLRDAHKMHFGVYASVERVGDVRVGDAVSIEPYDPGFARRQLDRAGNGVKHAVLRHMLRSER